MIKELSDTIFLPHITKLVYDADFAEPETRADLPAMKIPYLGDQEFQDILKTWQKQAQQICDDIKKHYPVAETKHFYRVLDNCRSGSCTVVMARSWISDKQRMRTADYMADYLKVLQKENTDGFNKIDTKMDKRIVFPRSFVSPKNKMRALIGLMRMCMDARDDLNHIKSSLNAGTQDGDAYIILDNLTKFKQIIQFVGTEILEFSPERTERIVNIMIADDVPDLKQPEACYSKSHYTVDRLFKVNDTGLVHFQQPFPRNVKPMMI